MQGNRRIITSELTCDMNGLLIFIRGAFSFCFENNFQDGGLILGN